jgi:heptosyltransferase-2
LKTFRGRILVIRGGAIGDFILTLPAIAALRKQFPEAQLEVLGYPHIAQLAAAAGLVDQVRSIEAGPLAGFFARNGTLATGLSDYFSDFDLIVSYLYDPDRIFQENVCRCAPGQFVVGPHRPDESAGVHATEVYLKPLERLAIFDADPVPRLVFSGRQISELELALHPGSGSEKKNWPEKNWVELLELLIHNTTFNLLLVGGEAEGERLQRLSAALPPARVRVAQSLPLIELGKALERCVGFVGHDSGISHLAAAVGLPGLLLWGNTSAAIWRPRSDHIHLLAHAEGLEKLEAKEVFETINGLTLSHRNGRR